MSTPTISPAEVDTPVGDTDVTPDRPWVVIVWNDPINLMDYVTFVFQKLFGYSLEKATELMLDAHTKGPRADARRPSQGPRRRVERHQGEGGARRLPSPRARAVGDDAARRVRAG